MNFRKFEPLAKVTLVIGILLCFFGIFFELWKAVDFVINK